MLREVMECGEYFDILGPSYRVRILTEQLEYQAFLFTAQANQVRY